MTANSVIELAPSSKEQIESFSKQILSMVLNGEANPLKIAIQINDMKKTFEKILEDKGFKEVLMDEVAKYGGKTFEAYGHKISISDSLGVKYDYDATGSTIWKRMKERLSAHEAMLKSLKEPMTIVDDETGEVITITPPIKKSSTGLKIETK